MYQFGFSIKANKQFFSAKNVACYTENAPGKDADLHSQLIFFGIFGGCGSDILRRSGLPWDIIPHIPICSGLQKTA